MNGFFYSKKNKISFLRYLDFEVFVKSTNSKFCDAIIDVTAYEKLHFWLFLLNHWHYQNEIWSNVNAAYDGFFYNVLSSILKTETSSRPFYNFNKIAKSWDLLMFGGWYLLCLVSSIHTFKIVENQKIIILGYREIYLSL